MESASEPSASVAFGRFRLSTHRRELLADGRAVKLGGRAFDVLMALIEARGTVVTKDALMARVWPDRIVEENNLQTNIAALRKAFGPDRELIHTVSGRGYQFTGEISTALAGAERQFASGMIAAETAPQTNLPQPVSELIGREDELREILKLATAHRLVTLTGAGGIGKTQLAFAAARGLLARFAGGVWLIELAAVSDPGLVPAAVAAALGVVVAGGTASAERVANVLSGKELLLVLDNCEHVIDATAVMAEKLLQTNPAAHVIATSREALKAEGEWVFPVPPLAVPAADRSDQEDLLRYAAVRLFIERAQAAELHQTPDRHGAVSIATICRRLDGIPLAIELAAARAATLGIEELAARLDDRFQLLTGGRRTVLPRHQTLRATLDWSYELLPETERVVLRRLAIFVGGFTLKGANAVAVDDEISPLDVADYVANLVAKSLVTGDADGTRPRYWLLETTRAYALEKLIQSGEFDAVARRHARRFLDLFKGAETEAATRPTDEWLADYGPSMANLRAALDWTFSPNGDASVGVALTAAAVPLWMQLSLMEECRGRVERALAAIAAGTGGDPRCEMHLHAALAASLMYTSGAVSKICAAGTKALEIAERLGNTEYQLRSLFGLWSFYINCDQQFLALTLARRFHALAADRSERNDRLIGERMIGTSQYYLGDLRSARCHLERVLTPYVTPVHKSQIFRFEVDQWAAARAYLSRVLWLQGLPDQAMQTAESSVAEAQVANHAMSVGLALALAACPIALLIGDLDAEEHYVGMLLDDSTRHALARWRAFGRSYQGVLVIQRGDLSTGLRLLRAAFDEPGSADPVPQFFALLMAEALGRAGQIADGFAAIEEAIGRAERSGERWATAEMLRIKGELFLLQGAPGATAAAEDLFRQALDWAHRQSALSWELRCAMSLARLWRDGPRSDEARELLASVYDRFTEGFDTADLQAAKALLEDS